MSNIFTPFSESEFEHLHSLWDGKASNVKEVCGKCGACCNNTDKTLLPGEYEYLERKTGQKNTSWCSKGCLCMQVGSAKPVICKIFPLQIKVSLEGYKVLWDETSEHYSKSCVNLEYTEKERTDLNRFLAFLFARPIYRLFWGKVLSEDYLKKDVYDHYDKLNRILTEEETEDLVFRRLIGADISSI